MLETSFTLQSTSNSIPSYWPAAAARLKGSFLSPNTRGAYTVTIRHHLQVIISLGYSRSAVDLEDSATAPGDQRHPQLHRQSPVHFQLDLVALGSDIITLHIRVIF